MRLDLDKHAERNDAYDFTLSHAADGMFFHAGNERMRLKLFVSERNSVLLAIRRKNNEFVRLTDGKNFLDVFDMSPGKVYDVREAIESVHADERAERSGAFYDAAYDHIRNDVSPENIFFCFAFRLRYFAVACDDFMFGVVDFKRGNDEFFAYVFSEIANESFLYLRRRNEDIIGSETSGKTFFDVLIDFDLEVFAVSDRIYNLIGFFDLVDGFFGKENATGCGVFSCRYELRVRRPLCSRPDYTIRPY